MVSAWASENRLVLGQVKTSEKSNEITAIPELLNLLEIKGCIVTIDAMGCQKKIARQIAKQGGDYVLGLKGNQGSLLEAVENIFEQADTETLNSDQFDFFQTTARGHGREETRFHYTTSERKHPANAIKMERIGDYRHSRVGTDGKRKKKYGMSLLYLQLVK